MVFPLITFPYSSRILEAEGIGVINFYNSIISYISLVTCLGIPLYATREIAKVKHDPSLTSKTSAEVLVFHVGLTVLGYIVVALICVFVPKIRENWPIFLLLSASLIFTAMGCDWYFRGTEDFKFITIRGLIVRIIYIPLLFIFVRTKSDLLMYAGLTVFVTVGNNLFNFYKIIKVISFKEIKDAVKVPFRHLKGSVQIFLLNASISLYLQMNILILGFLSSSTSVGYFTAASRFTYVVSGIIVALQTTLLPRGASLLSQDNLEAFKNIMTKVLNFIFCVTLPMSAGLIVMSPLIIKLFAGDSFSPAIPTLQLLSINVIFSIFNGVLCGGMLVPLGKETLAMYACLIGGIVSIAANFILVPFFSQNGSALASIITEIAVGIGMIALAKKYIPVKLWKRSYFTYLFSSLIMFAVCSIIWSLSTHEAYRLVVTPVTGIIVYILLLNLIKDNFYLSLQSTLFQKLKLIKS